MKYVRAVEAADAISRRFGIPMAELSDVIATIPDADVAPVVHGEWVTSNPINPEKYPMYVCSVCGKNGAVIYKLNYCPNCGARMEVKTDEFGL